ncbi:GNAT family N-acetyltransferase [Metabacillus litoralis]|uniref:GNAT family N-acetyltransferase n=1 Tax=Metabacillus litoralis TaxID=152268 RepID=UPI001CFE58CF|nr:GNAT family N-acetyltransferase [Metabacillus litoralis]
MKKLTFRGLNELDHEFFKYVIEDSHIWKIEEEYENDLERYLLSYQMYNGQWRLWSINNEPIGISFHLEWSPSNERPWIGTILVHPSHRLKGLGKEIIIEIGHDLKSKGHKACYVGCSIHQDGWLQFLAKCGFEQFKMEKDEMNSKKYMISVMPL